MTAGPLRSNNGCVRRFFGIIAEEIAVRQPGFQSLINIEPIEPKTAVEWYLEDRSNELAATSLESQEYTLGHFLRWCKKEGIENLNTLTGRKLHKFRIWRREDGDLNKVSEKSQMDTCRVFIRWLESIDGVEQDLSEKVVSPSITPEENSRDVMLDTDRASKVLTHLKKYQYASVEHVTISLMWHTMMRTGSVHALDLGDYHPEKQYIEVRHRPETGTPIKNKTRGERLVAISDGICVLLDDWINTKRPNMTDEHGREPLLTTSKGRLSKSTLRQYVYDWTRPCVYGEDCPHERQPSDCEALSHGSSSKCPSTVSPHAIRRGSITHGLNNDMPDKIVSGRANVSLPILEKHYDARTEREKMEKRREYLDNL